MTSPLNEPPSVAQNKIDVTNHLIDEEIASEGGADITFPEYRKMKIQRKFRAPEEENQIFDLNPPPTLLMNTDTSQTCTLGSQCIN